MNPINNILASEFVKMLLEHWRTETMIALICISIMFFISRRREDKFVGLIEKQQEIIKKQNTDLLELKDFIKEVKTSVNKLYECVEEKIQDKKQKEFMQGILNEVKKIIKEEKE